jgi:serine/threonine protein kinase
MLLELAHNKSFSELMKKRKRLTEPEVTTRYLDPPRPPRFKTHGYHFHSQSLSLSLSLSLESQVQYYMLQILNALVYLHGIGVIHRDLKLGNLLLDKVPGCWRWLVGVLCATYGLSEHCP